MKYKDIVQSLFNIKLKYNQKIYLNNYNNILCIMRKMQA